MTKKSNLKIAVQMFGHLRTFEECAPELYKHLLNKYDCDIFMHTWSTLNHNTKTWHNDTGLNGDTNEADIRKHYPQIKSLEIEEQHPKELGNAFFEAVYKPEKPSEISIFGLSAMFHSMSRANKLREEYEKKHDIKYDWVICIRPDILLKRDIDILNILRTESPENINRGVFSFTSIFTQVVRGIENYGALDVFYFATPKVISKIYKNLPNPEEEFKSNTTYHLAPEYSFAKKILDSGLIFYRADYKYCEDFVILRPHKPTPFRRRLIRLHIWKHNTFYLAICPGLLPPLIDFDLCLFDKVHFKIVIGKPKSKDKK